jgi:hypothetical protein
MPSGLPGQGGRGPWIASAPAPSPLVIVTHGNSVLRGEGASAGHQPSDIVGSLRGLSVFGSGASTTTGVVNECVNGQDIDYYISNFSVQVHPHFNSSFVGASVVVIGETSDYIDDTRGAAGDSLSLSDPTAAGLANYNKHVTYAQAAIALGWKVAVVCMPDAVEPSTYADSTANASYRTARDHSYDLMLADTTNFYRVINCRARSEFSSPWSTTYYVNAPNGERIHLQDAGYDLEGTVISAGLP